MSGNRRVSILMHWLRGTRNNVSAAEMVRFLVGLRRSTRARQFIETLTVDSDGLLRLSLKGINRPVFLPASLNEQEVYQVICDVLAPESWHYYEKQQTVVRPGDVVADCGASEGIFTLSVADRCKKVFVVEPLPSFLAVLRRTLVDLDNITLIPFALGANEGEGFISDEGINSQFNAYQGTHRIKVCSIDALFARRGQKLDYIKADLEGAEVSMLRGAVETIRAYAPRIAITTYHHPHHAEQISALLKQINPAYQIYVKGIMPQDGRPVMLHAWVD